jgi:hypothetical protein
MSSFCLKLENRPRSSTAIPNTSTVACCLQENVQDKTAKSSHRIHVDGSERQRRENMKARGKREARRPW